MTKFRKNIDIDKIIKLYLDNKSMNEIARELKCCSSAIKKRLIFCNIPLRSHKEANKLKAQKFKGSKNPSWKGGNYINPDGYKSIRLRNHSRTRSNGYVFEHIIIWEKAHKKPLPKDYIIHHLNGIKIDNRPENLIAMKRGAHIDLIKPFRKRIRILEEEIRKLKDIKPVIS